MKTIANLIFLICLTIVSESRWTEDQAAKWYSGFRWSAGFNYAPSYAVNEIEMWTSYNATTIDRELGWAQIFGFSKLRVFLHISPFITEQSRFLDNFSNLLAIAKRYGHQVIPVLFDDCWNSDYHAGQQPNPIPGIHNSQWVQCPGTVPVTDTVLQNYVVTILNKYKNDASIAFWDLYNEVGNSGHLQKSLPLLRKVFGWARNVMVSQPLSSGLWNTNKEFENINSYILLQSDVITFHAYCDVSCTLNWINQMASYKRPVICTEYMARSTGSKFITHLPVFKEQKVWAINWGFVFGRTQTYYPWGSKKDAPVPQIWFHDVVHANGTSFDKNETDFITKITQTSLEIEQ